MIVDMPLQGGVDQDQTTWLGSDYPGALTSFEPRQTDGSNIFNPRLLVVHVSTWGNDETLTLSGEVSEILHASAQWSESNAAPGLGQHEETGTLINDASHLLTSETTVNTDGTAASTSFATGDEVYDGNGAFVGVIASTTSTSITLEANALVQVNDNTNLRKRQKLVLTNRSGTTESCTLMMLVR